jgi:L-histidine N-alpha-methyltransferase
LTEPPLRTERRRIPRDALTPVDPAVAEQVREGLARSGQKRLPSWLLYDHLGSALFETISYLPEYGLTRADERILRRCAEAIVRPFASPLLVAELGSGSGRKTRWILSALAARQTTRYYPIDISPTALARCEAELGRLPSVRLEAIEADYLTGLRTVTDRRQAAQPLLVLFLGSTIGNFEPDEGGAFLSDTRALMSPGDALLLGTDLVKSPKLLHDAYDDALGITAAFNRNLLVRLNREVGADFEVASFRHEARWSGSERRVEMHLVARRAHTVRIRALDLAVPFGSGESIWTESSYKFEAGELPGMAEKAGFRMAGQWIDEEWPFAESLFVAR